jgi:hypothetical protein
MLNSVNVEYWIGTGSHNNVPMTNTTRTDWEYTISIPDSLDKLYYIFHAEDLYLNTDLTDQINLTIIDNDPTVFISDSTPTVITTGEDNAFEIEVTDNIEIDQVWVEYWFDPDELINATMMKIGTDQYRFIFIVQPWETYPLHYIFHANDTSNNWNSTDEVVVNVTDNDLVMFITDKTPTTATTGDSFTFKVEVTDNIMVSGVWVEYEYDSIIDPINLSMTESTEDNWEVMITTPHTLDDIEYIFRAIDLGTAWNSSDKKTITMIDNDSPVFGKYQYPTTQYTGDEFTFQINITDNIELNNASMEYWFGTLGTHSSSPLLETNGQWQATIDIPIDSVEQLHFRITAFDTSSNSNLSMTYDVTVVDGISPTIELVEDLTIGAGEMFNLTVTATDNIGITEVIWTDSPIESTDLKLEGTVDTAGEYLITLIVKDAAGNMNSTTFTLTVMEGTVDTDSDGMPNSWEIQYDLDPEDASDANNDPDNDDLTNLEEYIAGTNPKNSDSDGDGMPDGWESKYGLDPMTPSADNDEDGDGKTDFEEYRDGTNPVDKETEDEEDNQWLILLLLLVVVVVVIVVAVLFLKKRKTPEEPAAGTTDLEQVQAPGESVTETAPPPYEDMPVSRPYQELVSEDQVPMEQPLYPDVSGADLPDQVEIPTEEQPPRLDLPRDEVGQIPAPLPAEQLPGTAEPQPQLPPGEPEGTVPTAPEQSTEPEPVAQQEEPELEENKEE